MKFFLGSEARENCVMLLLHLTTMRQLLWTLNAHFANEKDTTAPRTLTHVRELVATRTFDQPVHAHTLVLRSANP